MLKRIRHHTISAALIAALALPISAPASAVFAAPSPAAKVVQQTTQAGPYRLILMIGPLEKMYTQAQVKQSHPKSGEVMIRGTMVMGGMGMTMGDAPNHHLEVHVLLKSTGKAVSNATVKIGVWSAKGKLVQQVPIAVMQGVKAGANDIHYGNNVALKDGTYQVRVQVGSVKATFNVMLSSSSSMPGM
jgi:5-hydroxyisourate hydrolase-like protein (transthyretin family)